MYLALVLKTITYGSFMALYNGVQELNDSVYGISDTITQFQKDSLYIERFRTFLNYEPKMKDGKNPLPEERHKKLRLLECFQETAGWLCWMNRPVRWNR